MSKYPALLAGQRFTAALALSMIPDVVVKQAAQSTPASSTVVQNDLELITPTLGVGTWLVEFWVSFTSATQVFTTWANTGTMTIARRMEGPGVTAGGGTANQNATVDVSGHYNISGAATANVQYGNRTGGSSYWVREVSMTTVTVAGVITWQFGQFVATPTPTVCNAGSFVRSIQVA